MNNVKGKVSMEEIDRNCPRGWTTSIVKPKETNSALENLVSLKEKCNEFERKIILLEEEVRKLKKIIKILS